MTDQANPNPPNPSLDAARAKLREKAQTERGLNHASVSDSVSIRKSEIDWSKIELPSVDEIYTDADDDPLCLLAPLSMRIYTFEPTDPLVNFLRSGETRELLHILALSQEEQDKTLAQKSAKELEQLAKEDLDYSKRLVLMAINGVFLQDGDNVFLQKIKVVDKPAKSCNRQKNEYPLKKIPINDIRALARGIILESSPQSDEQTIASFRRMESNGNRETPLDTGILESENVWTDPITSDGDRTQNQEPEPDLFSE